MRPSQLLVSLLSTEDSEQLLTSMHAVLLPGASAQLALLRPLAPRLGVAALQLTGAAVAVISDARALVDDGIAGAPDRHFVWCRDDADVASAAGGNGTAIVAETIDELAWDLVRRLAGDLRDAAPERTLPMPVATRGPEPHTELRPASSQAAVANPSQGTRRDTRMPPPPSWAQGVPSAARRIDAVGAPAEQVSDPPVLLPASEQPSAVPAEPPPNDSPSGLPITPLAALAGMHQHGARVVEVSGRAQGPRSVRGTEATHDSGWQGIGRLRGLFGRAEPSRGERPALEVSGLGQALLRAHSTVVTVGTPKGGPGKTTEAAAIGVLGARAVEPLGGSAVLVDANLNNPDSWRQLSVAADALTVREVVEALNRGAIVPNGEFARNERLRVLPERRSAGSAYSAAEIARLVQHLRQRHTLIVVDLPNSLPSLSEGPKEALVAHWLGHADVVVLPIDLGEASFIAAGEILDAIDEMVAGADGRIRPGLVVPLLLPDDGRRALELPAIAELLDHLRDAGAAVVHVPYTVDVQTASHRRSPIVGASPRTDRAFVGVLRAVVAASSKRQPTTSHG